jgi:hypothetical protein
MIGQIARTPDSFEENGVEANNYGGERDRCQDEGALEQNLLRRITRVADPTAHRWPLNN